MVDLDVIVVTYRSEKCMQRLLPDLHSMSVLSHDLKVFDNTENKITLTMAWNNLWKSGSSPFVAFLNPDILLSPQWDARLVECLSIDPSVAVTMGNRYVPSGDNDSQEKMSSLANRLQQTPQYRALGEHLEGFYAVVIRRSALEALSGFDERFRFYFQDSDFQLRCLHRLKLQTVQVNHCPIWHIGMVSTKEAVHRGELDRDEELRHVDRVRAELSSGSLLPWDELTPEARLKIRQDSRYNRLSRKVM